ncbi:tryptophan halogenase family protein [Paraglaciecola sp.]|uniref:tryptophan halogenase family protein n=1 Tax=Paraglaciecola sp. TaxID=1920173 RepID=UPI0030F44487
MRIKNVVIAGGGTAGWMAAAALSKLLGKNLTITLVESDEIATVGVGEATIPTLLTFHQLLGIKEAEFMAATQATFKLGIDFQHWLNPSTSYIHSFGSVGRECWAAGFQHFWRRGLDLGIDDDYGQYCLELEAAKANKFAHLKQTTLRYAYHLDATLYARYLRKFSEKLGVKRVEGKIVEVKTDLNNGHIQSLLLASGQQIEGDFFIDCTGFASLLIEKTLHTGYEDWSHCLPCDSAVAVQTQSTQEAIPYTRAIAHAAGWQWRIPLQSRVGNGLVYCSRYCPDDEAKRSLLANVEGEAISDPRLIKFRTGQRKQHWNKNCVALGLAAGFIEPLESTSIHLIQRGILRLLQLFPEADINVQDADEYNVQTKMEMESIRDFIILHYHLNQRDGDPFWRYLRNMDIPPSLVRRINLFQQSGRFFHQGDELFGEYSWAQVMLGQGIKPKGYHPIVDLMTATELQTFLHNIRNPIKRTIDVMPSHHDYIQRYCKSADH